MIMASYMKFPCYSFRPFKWNSLDNRYVKIYWNLKDFFSFNFISEISSYYQLSQF